MNVDLRKTVTNSPIYEPDPRCFPKQEQEELSDELEKLRKNPQCGVKIGEVELTVISDL